MSEDLRENEDPRYRFILDIMVDNVRAVLGSENLYVRHERYPYPDPPSLNGVTPDIYSNRAGVCIAADVALGEDMKAEMKHQAALVDWAAAGPSRHYWLGIPLSYDTTDRHEQWQREGLITLHPFQI
ncbi:MAG: hypothetical protein R6U70_03265 [Bacillota bacterium]|jgi:hypothetical protein